VLPLLHVIVEVSSLRGGPQSTPTTKARSSLLRVATEGMRWPAEGFHFWDPHLSIWAVSLSKNGNGEKLNQLGLMLEGIASVAGPAWRSDSNGALSV